MVNVQKISQYFFILAAVVAILDGAFTLDEDMKAIKFVFLILAGIIVGVLKHTEEKEFLISGVAVVITGYVLVQLLGTYFFLEGIGLMLLNFIVFLSSALVVVGIQQVGGSLTFPELFMEEEKKLTKKQKDVKELKREAFTRVWGVIVLIAVALTFIILIADMFFDIAPYKNLVNAVDIVITTLFIADLFILYEQSKGFKDFMKKNIFDVVAAIPTFGVLRALKIVRAFRVIKMLRGGTHLTKVVKMYKTGKFFSEESYFNSLEKDKVHKGKSKKK